MLYIRNPAACDFEPKVKVTLNLSLLRCMLFANYSRNFYPIFMKFGKRYFLVLRQLPWKFQEKILCSLKVRPFEFYCMSNGLTFAILTQISRNLLGRRRNISCKLIKNWVRNWRNPPTLVEVDCNYRLDQCRSNITQGELKLSLNLMLAEKKQIRR